MQQAAWAELGEPWRASLEEAWASWVQGSAGVGAVVTDASGAIVARGRNRMGERPDTPGVLAGTRLAHAEMNALALVPVQGTDGWSLTTTFEPCLMCASAIVQSRIAHVHFAASDPHFDGLDGWFRELPFAAERLPGRSRLGGRIGAFAQLLHLSWLAGWLARDPDLRALRVVESHRRANPAHVKLAQAIVADNRLGAVASGGGTVLDALGSLWPDLEALGS